MCCFRVVSAGLRARPSIGKATVKKPSFPEGQRYDDFSDNQKTYLIYKNIGKYRPIGRQGRSAAGIEQVAPGKNIGPDDG